MHRTPFHDLITARGARMVPFAGWEMPVTFAGLVEEHHAVRRTAGVFDVSHMGRLEVSGPDAAAFLDRLCTRHVAPIKPGQVRYSLLCNAQGGVIDDILVGRVSETGFNLVVNGANHDAVLEWFADHIGRMKVTVTDRTFETAMLAVQGPAAMAVMTALGAPQAASLKYYGQADMDLGGLPACVSRTGYTGEDGVEITVPAVRAAELWERLFAAGAAHGLVPAGLGARDTLRLEAGMPLYGHELSVEINPLEAGLGYAVALDKPGGFSGVEALRKVNAAGPRRMRAGFALAGRNIPREGYELLAGGAPCGKVTSGTFSPTFEHGIAMGYVTAGPDTGNYAVRIRDKAVPARRVPLPFYKRPQT
ncbi:MAG: glycine cleavage system aminomethyltransferase GcvT [Planctomycetota bacterium]